MHSNAAVEHAGYSLREMREAKDLTQTEVAVRGDLSLSSLQKAERYERFKIGRKTLRKIAVGLGLDDLEIKSFLGWAIPLRENKIDKRKSAIHPPSAPASPAAENNLANLSREEITRRIDELRQVAHDKGIRWPMGIEDKHRLKAAKQRKGKRGDERSPSTQKPENSPIQPSTPKGKHMPQVPPWHWDRDKERYHNNTRCGPGSEIPQQHRIAGTGGKKLCDHCAKLNAEGK